MRSSKYTATIIIILLVFLPIVMNARHIPKLNSYDQRHVPPTKKATLARPMMAKRADTLQVAGSRLPDCSHACGSCKPCRLVMVSFVCSSLEEAETCPVAYKCMCHNKSYPVP
ncbi:protein EPIDERMAL PATTERNING FACTOR 1 isoform X1 [Solanum dulcamara]|uniref:protein EPIDERMAL PATTERNING FACTOR 1 isoform X1 n=1 Tax=Solanum dulcamara TaxID=45834 RepID=UPI002485FB44|nr:protein EPIDERMAL PATTERNING FACTOR 1 isoform X1 [Solanum dulcamara]